MVRVIYKARLKKKDSWLGARHSSGAFIQVLGREDARLESRAPSTTVTYLGWMYSAGSIMR